MENFMRFIDKNYNLKNSISACLLFCITNNALNENIALAHKFKHL
jgi:hypothetical protein